MKVLIYGAGGWIGKQFISQLDKENVEYYEGKSRCDNMKDVYSEIIDTCPTHVISMIGRTHGEGCSNIDYLETHLKENVRDNLFSPFILASLCRTFGIHYTYLGTGCIFEGEGFTETSIPNYFGSSYSVVKGYTDRMMHLFTCLNLRIRMPISSYPHSRNFVTKITSYEKICSIPNSMTVLDDFFPVIIDLMKNKTIGTLNMTNPGVISHNEILDMYIELVDKDFKYQNFTKDEQSKILKADRSNNELNTNKLETMYPYIPDIKTSVRRCLEKYKINK